MSTKTKRPAKSAPPWPALLMVVGGLVLAGVAYLAWSNAAGPSASVTVKGAARLTVDREQIDFGNVKLGETVEARFTLTNIGDQPVRFTEAPYIELIEGC